MYLLNILTPIDLLFRFFTNLIFRVCTVPGPAILGERRTYIETRQQQHGPLQYGCIRRLRNYKHAILTSFPAGHGRTNAMESWL